MVSEATHLRHHLANPFLVIVVLAIVVDHLADLFFFWYNAGGQLLLAFAKHLKTKSYFYFYERLSKLNQASRELKKLFGIKCTYFKLRKGNIHFFKPQYNVYV